MLHRKKGGQISGFFVFLCVIFLIWTCILLAMGYRQYNICEFANKKISTILETVGMKQTTVLRFLQEEENENFTSKIVVGRTSLLQYILKNENTIPREQEKNIVKLASFFVGKNSENVFWSAAASKRKNEWDLYSKSDSTLVSLCQQEKKSEENDKTAKETTAAASPQIVLFNNGSFDITSANQVNEKKEKKASLTTNDSILCDSAQKLIANKKTIAKLKKSYSRSYLLQKFYITDSSTSIDNSVFQTRKLINMDMTLKKEKKPQILIFHTHGASESFIDSRKGSKADSIVGIGGCLAKVLSERYGYQVIHDETEYDRVNGGIDRSLAYNYSYKGVVKTLKKYPSIQVVIDLHRDGVGNKAKRTTIVNGKRTAQVMFFNGLSRNASGNIKYLYNENLQGNLAFSLQMKIACMNRFENFVKPIYLKGYRYNMQLKKRFTLIELGNENNTVNEEKNATYPLAMAIDSVLSGK